MKGDDLAATRASVDFLGLNFYSPMHIAAAPGTVTGAWFGALPAGMPVTHMGWPIAPDGLLTQLRELRDDYGNPDIHITENGAAFDDVVEADGAVRDPLRIAYLGPHVRRPGGACVRRQLRGYFAWSLLDNFEWALGLLQALRHGARRLRDASAHSEGVIPLDGRRHPYAGVSLHRHLRPDLDHAAGRQPEKVAPRRRRTAPAR